MKALVVRVDGQTEIVDIEINDHNAINDLVNGWIEMVNLHTGFMYVNEEGKLMNLPVNHKMTRFCLQKGFIRTDDFIVGNAVIVGQLDEEGYHEEVSDTLVEDIINF